MGVPTPSSPEDDDIETGLDAVLPEDVVVELREVPRMEAVEICMHPFGEHTSFSGQHPPPAAARHSTRGSRHFGGWDSDA
jgi:hypothetical protein